MVQEEAVANKKAEETIAIADDAQKDLDQALPALEAANKVCSYTNIRSCVQSVLIIIPKIQPSHLGCLSCSVNRVLSVQVHILYPGSVILR